MNGTNKRTKVEALINELEPNFERIMDFARDNNLQPFNGSKKRLKEWLIANQKENKFIKEVYLYFLPKCKFNKKNSE